MEAFLKLGFMDDYKPLKNLLFLKTIVQILPAAVRAATFIECLSSNLNLTQIFYCHYFHLTDENLDAQRDRKTDRPKWMEGKDVNPDRQPRGWHSW